jgi:hypothetical protein
MGLNRCSANSGSVQRFAQHDGSIIRPDGGGHVHFCPGPRRCGSLVTALATKGIANTGPDKGLIGARKAGGIDDHVMMQGTCTKKNGSGRHGRQVEAKFQSG